MKILYSLKYWYCNYYTSCKNVDNVHYSSSLVESPLLVLWSSELDDMSIISWFFFFFSWGASFPLSLLGSSTSFPPPILYVLCNIKLVQRWPLQAHSDQLLGRPHIWERAPLLRFNTLRRENSLSTTALLIVRHIRSSTRSKAPSQFNFRLLL